jgi:hypothetical protein
VRKGIFELIGGVLCVALVSGAALATHHRERLRAHWLRLCFLTSEKDAEMRYLQLAHSAPDLARGLSCAPEELEIYLDEARTVRVRNNRGHRVYVDSGDLSGTVLSPGESATLEKLLEEDLMHSIPLGDVGIGIGAGCGGFGYCGGGPRRKVRPRFGTGNGQ